jgi:hypothetical protein
MRRSVRTAKRLLLCAAAVLFMLRHALVWAPTVTDLEERAEEILDRIYHLDREVAGIEKNGTREEVKTRTQGILQEIRILEDELSEIEDSMIHEHGAHLRERQEAQGLTGEIREEMHALEIELLKNEETLTEDEADTIRQRIAHLQRELAAIEGPEP